MSTLYEAQQLLVALHVRLKNGRSQGITHEQLVEDAEQTLQLVARIHAGPTTYDRWCGQQMTGYLLQSPVVTYEFN